MSARGRQAHAGSHGAGHRSTIAGEDCVTVCVDLFVGQTEQSQEVRVRAEASVANSDAVLGAEARRNERVVHAVDRERGDRQRRRFDMRVEHTDAGNRGEG